MKAEAEQPEKQQNYEHCPEHGNSLWNRTRPGWGSRGPRPGRASSGSSGVATRGPAPIKGWGRRAAGPGSASAVRRRLAPFGSGAIGGLDRVTIQGGQKILVGFRGPNLAGEYVLPGPRAVHGAVSGLVRLYDVAIEADARERAAAARIRENLGVHGDIGGRTHVPAYRPRRGIGAGPQTHLVTQQVFQPRLGSEHHDDIGGLAADLQAPAASAHLDEHGRAPLLKVAANGHALAVGAAEDKGEVLLAGHDGDAFGSLQDLLRNSLVRGVHHFLKDRVRLLDAPDVVLQRRGGEGRNQQAEREGKGGGARNHEQTPFQ